MQQYLELLDKVMREGSDRGDRTGTGTRSVFGHQMRFDLSKGFPVLTTKKLHLRSIVIELLWFLRGETNIAWLKENGVSIWDEWADAHGELGQSMAISGAPGQIQRVDLSIRLSIWLSRSKPIQIRAG